MQAMKKAGIEPDEAEIGKYAENTITLEGHKAQQMLKLIEALEDNDDVQNVWANFDVSEKEMEAAAASCTTAAAVPQRRATFPLPGRCYTHRAA